MSLYKPFNEIMVDYSRDLYSHVYEKYNALLSMADDAGDKGNNRQQEYYLEKAEKILVWMQGIMKGRETFQMVR